MANPRASNDRWNKLARTHSAKPIRNGNPFKVGLSQIWCKVSTFPGLCRGSPCLLGLHSYIILNSIFNGAGSIVKWTIVSFWQRHYQVWLFPFQINWSIKRLPTSSLPEDSNNHIDDSSFWRLIRGFSASSTRRRGIIKAARQLDGAAEGQPQWSLNAMQFSSNSKTYSWLVYDVSSVNQKSTFRQRRPPFKNDCILHIWSILVQTWVDLIF